MFTPTEATEHAQLVARVESALADARSTVHGLTLDQLRERPVPSSELSLGWLLLHIGEVAEDWAGRAAAGPGRPATTLSVAERFDAFAHRNVIADDATLESVLAEFDRRRDHALELVRRTDLDAPVPVPDEMPWFPPDLPAFSGRWCVHHLLADIDRHCGHADILREAIDGRQMYDLIAESRGIDMSYIGAWFASHPEIPAPSW